MVIETVGPVRRVSAEAMLPASAGLFAIAMAVYQVASPGSPAATFETLLDWVREGLFVGYLATSVLGVRVAAREGLASRGVLLCLGIGYGSIGLGVIYGMVTRDDPDWFFVLAGPGNLLAAAAFVVWAAWGYRHQVLPPWAASMCGVGGVVAVLGAEFGTSVVVGGFWLYVAARLHSAAVDRSHQTQS
jgi:hypothetical protein